jgi:hypothetical protein
MRPKCHLFAALAVGAVAGRVDAEPCVTVQPADVRGVRLLLAENIGPLLLDFLAIKRDTEDRTLVELDLAQIPATGRMTLDMGIEDLDPGGEDGVIDAFTYPGDGTVTAEDFFSGTTRATRFVWNGVGVASVDVTEGVAAARAAGWSDLGLRLSTATGDRYFLGADLGRPPDPVLTVCALGTPEDIIDLLRPMVASFPALTNQVDQAAASLDRPRRLCHKLDTFMVLVRAKAGDGEIDPATAAQLLDLAERARALVDGC